MPNLALARPYIVKIGHSAALASYLVYRRRRSKLQHSNLFTYLRLSRRIQEETYRICG